MARLEAAKRLCFYPAPSDAIGALNKHLAVEDVSGTHILDPCAGEGKAIESIASGGLAMDHHNVYCVELHPERGQAIRELMHGRANVISPCSFFSASITAQSFGLVYCNPPFDDELGGGGREEEAFVRSAYRLLCTGGVLVLVAPYATMINWKFKPLLDSHFKDAALYRFPTLRYNECVFIGCKRSLPLVEERARTVGLLQGKMNLGHYSNFQIRGAEDLDMLGQRGRIWEEGKEWACELQPRQWIIPATWKPARFLKAGYTDEELCEAIGASRLNSLLVASEEPPIKQPPLPLERGHIALLLASGALDGLVTVAGGENHVVRGVSLKEEYYNEEASDCAISEDGETARVKDVHSERIKLLVRAVDNSGVIYTFTAEGSTSGEATDRAPKTGTNG